MVPEFVRVVSIVLDVRRVRCHALDMSSQTRNVSLSLGNQEPRSETSWNNLCERVERGVPVVDLFLSRTERRELQRRLDLRRVPR